MIRVGILGASGYTGYELVRILRHHPQVRLAALGAYSNAGQSMADLFDGAATWGGLPILQKTDDIDLSALDVVFCALPHGQSAEMVKLLMGQGNIRLIVDLSNDHRLRDYSGYDGLPQGHPYPEIAGQAVFGLSEWYGDTIPGARLIANPGCYPTSILLPILPLLQAGLIDPSQIIANSASGTSGAGRGASVGQLHAEVSENFRAYGLGTHRHALEIQEQVEAVAGPQDSKVIFNPHLLPMNRGILSTLTLTLTAKADLDQVQAALDQAYATAAFVQVAPIGASIATKSVRGTNLCRMAVHPTVNQGQILITSAIDNLMKGASGQAVQNMNLALGWDEGLGLTPLSALQP